jgi:hypothetical protein
MENTSLFETRFFFEMRQEKLSCIGSKFCDSSKQDLGFFGNKLTWRTGLLFKKEVVLME